MSPPNEMYGRKREAFEIELYRTFPEEPAGAIKLLIDTDPDAIGPMLGAMAKLRKDALDHSIRRWETIKDRVHMDESSNLYELFFAAQKIATIWAEYRQAFKESLASPDKKFDITSSPPSAE